MIFRASTDGAGHGGAERSRSEAEAEWSGTVSGAISRSSENHGGSGQSAEDRPIDSGNSRRPANHPGTLFLVGLVDIAVLGYGSELNWPARSEIFTSGFTRVFLF